MQRRIPSDCSEEIRYWEILALDGEQADCRRWREEGGERVAAVGERRSRTVGKEITGHRNRTPGLQTEKE